MRQMIYHALLFSALIYTSPAFASDWRYEAGNGVCALRATTATETDIRLMVSADQPEGLYQGALRLTHAGDFQAGDFLIHRCKHLEACDGGSDWGSI